MNKKKKKNVREAALEVLETIDKQQSYSNLLLNQVIKKYEITGPDKGLLTELVYGTIQRKLTLDYYLQPFLKKQPDHWVLLLLRLSLYQIVYLDKIPERAAIYEAVEITKKRGHRGITSMVNGVLRSIQRKGLPSLEAIEDPLQRLSIETSHPYWLVKRWSEQFGYEKTREICEINLLAPLQTGRVNTMAATREQVLEELEKEGFIVQPSPIIPSAIRSMKGNLAQSTAYRNGHLTVQDESSMAVGYALNIEPGQHVLDACAAPGGKTTHIAELLKNTGYVTALDLHPHKIKLITENASRLGLTNIEAKVMDSREAGEILTNESFDRVLVDAPCSGLGVLRRKPDIKYSKSEADIESLAAIQRTILNEAARLVKIGGLLVYSTCTIDKEENNGTINEFIAAHPEFEPHPLQLPSALLPLAHEHTLQIFPQDFGGDGFFIACFKKR